MSLKFSKLMNSYASIVKDKLHIIAYDNNSVWIENYKAILLVTESCIVLKAEGIKLEIIGRLLFIDYYSADEMKISGDIYGIKYIKQDCYE